MLKFTKRRRSAPHGACCGQAGSGTASSKKGVCISTIATTPSANVKKMMDGQESRATKKKHADVTAKFVLA